MTGAPTGITSRTAKPRPGPARRFRESVVVAVVAAAARGAGKNPDQASGETEAASSVRTTTRIGRPARVTGTAKLPRGGGAGTPRRDPFAGNVRTHLS